MYGGLFSKSVFDIWASGNASILEVFAKLGVKLDTDAIEPLSWALYEKGKKVSGADYLVAQGVLQSMARDAARFMQIEFLHEPCGLSCGARSPPVHGAGRRTVHAEIRSAADAHACRATVAAWVVRAAARKPAPSLGPGRSFRSFHAHC